MLWGTPWQKLARKWEEIRVALQELVRCPLNPTNDGGLMLYARSRESADRSLVTDSEAHGMDAVVKILRIALMEAERKIAEATITFPCRGRAALDVVPDQGKPQFHVVEEQSIAA